MDKDIIKIFLVDDHKLMLEGMVAMFTTQEGIEVVGYASSGEEAVNMVSAVQPHIVLMDIMLKKMSGIEACRWIKERYPDIKIILLSMEVKKEYLTAGIQSGISGYLPKDIDRNTLIDAVRSVHSGNQYFTDALTKLVFEDFYHHEKLKGVSKQKLPDQLTKREYEVLGLVAQGKNNRQISETLFISIKTVETHKTHILEKLGLKNTAELIRYAIKNNIVNI